MPGNVRMVRPLALRRVFLEIGSGLPIPAPPTAVLHFLALPLLLITIPAMRLRGIWNTG